MHPWNGIRFMNQSSHTSIEKPRFGAGSVAYYLLTLKLVLQSMAQLIMAKCIIQPFKVYVTYHLRNETNVEFVSVHPRCSL